MYLKEAINIIRKYADEIITEMNFNFENTEEKELYINEIIAYFIVSFYGKNPRENTTDYVKKYTKNKLLSASTDIKDNDPNYNEDDCVKRVQRTTKKYVTARYWFYKKMSHSLLNLPKRIREYINHFENTRGKNNKKLLDRANMIFLNQIATAQKRTVRECQIKTFGLLNLLLKNVTNSDRVPTPDLAKAYMQIEALYKEAKSTKKPEDYIAHWVNSYRLEKNLFPTLINSMADYMIENKLTEIPFNKSHIDNIFHTYICTLDKPIECTFLIDTFAILNYSKWIPYLFDKNSIEDFSNYILESRFDENKVIFFIKNKIRKHLEQFNVEINNEDIMENFFLHYVKKEDFYKNQTLYEFCKNSYPIIERHITINVYQGLSKRISYKKIKYIREITEMITPYDDLKEYFKDYSE